MEFKNVITRMFCIGCTLYVEDKLSCCYLDGSGKDKYCLIVLEKTKRLFNLRSIEGYRLAIVKDGIDDVREKVSEINLSEGKLKSYTDAILDLIELDYVKEIKDK
jgi:hypothetical protein